MALTILDLEDAELAGKAKFLTAQAEIDHNMFECLVEMGISMAFETVPEDIKAKIKKAKPELYNKMEALYGENNRTKKKVKDADH